ncbi:MAG TPA: hypothetical protein VGM90_22780 [Kofleriaceae bacterium]|jgi:hypothetical protein
MGSQRTGLIVTIAIIVIALLAGLFAYKMFGSSDPVVATARHDDEHARPVKDRPAQVVPRLPDQTAPTPDDPAAPKTGSGETDRFKQYEINGKVVRDHRTGLDGDAGVWTPPETPADKLPKPRAPKPQADGRQVAPQLTQALGEGIKGVMRECAAQIPKQARGAQPRMLATVTMSIQNKTATITDADIVLRDVIAGPPVDAATACMKEKLVGVTQATDEADVASYDLAISYLL